MGACIIDFQEILQDFNAQCDRLIILGKDMICHMNAGNTGIDFQQQQGYLLGYKQGLKRAGAITEIQYIVLSDLLQEATNQVFNITN